VPPGVFNDRILRIAARSGLEVLEVLELRDVCTAPADFVMQIEPSALGAREIADAIAQVPRGEPSVETGRIHSPASREV
jgi:hypothetical protein